MNTFFITLKKYSKEAASYLLYATGFFCLLFYVGNFGDGFLPVIANLFLMLVELGLWLLIPILLSTGKQDLAKSALRPIFTFWLVSTVFTFLQECTQIGGWALTTAMGVFELLVACAFIVIAVLTVFASVKKDQKLKKIAFLILAGCLILYLVIFSLRVAAYAKVGMGWNSYLEAIYRFLTLPFGMFFLAQHFEFTLDDMTIFEEKVTLASPTKTSEPAPAKEPAPAPVQEEPAPGEEAGPVKEPEPEKEPEPVAPAADSTPVEEAPATENATVERSAEEEKKE